MNIYFIVTLLIIFGGFFCKKNYYFYFMITWLWIITAFNNGGIDYETYELIFSGTSSQVLDLNIIKGERLFYSGIYIFNILKLTFFEYSFLLSSISIIILCYIINKYTENYRGKNLILSCMYIFPMVDNIIQKRNFIASGLINLAIILLIEKKKSYKLKYLILVLVAYNIHNSMILYLVLILISLFSIKQIKKISILLTLIIGFILPIIPLIISKLFPFYASKIILYLENIDNRLSIGKVICFGIIHLIMFFLVNYSIKNTEKNKYNEVILKINYINLIFIPLYYYNLIFFRMYRNMYIFFYILIINSLNHDKFRKKIVKLFILYTYLILLFIIFYGYFGKYKYSGMVDPLFIKNKFFYFLN